MPETFPKFVEAPFGTSLYHASLDLRDQTLRKPLGLEFSADEIEAEQTQFHFVLLDKEEVVGCVVAVPLDGNCYKLRQMAIAAGRRSQGLGRWLLEQTEAHLAKLGAREFTLHARDVAVGFYQKLGYELVGEPFVEVTVPHQAMLKQMTVNNLNPFHLAIQVHDLAAARKFYGDVLGCPEGRSSDTWVDFDFFGHQFVCHENRELQVAQHHSAVDGHAAPTPHFGVVLDMDRWRALADRVRATGIEFVIEPYVRFAGEPGEQATMFFCDPSGNALEFKAFKDIAGQLFAK